MLKPSQIIEQKAFTYKTLTSKDMEQTTEFLVKNNRNYPSASEEQRTRLFALTRCLLIPCLSNHWSYGMVVDEKLSSVSLQLDVLDFIKILDTIGDNVSLSDVLDISLFANTIRNLGTKIKRGDYVLCLMHISGSEKDRKTIKKQIKFIYQGFLICQIGGWRNVLFSTQNPVPFLKVNADVIDENNEQTFQNTHYLMKLKLSKMSLMTSPFQNMYPRL